ncbi:MAG: hypothetical protein HKN23_21680 [Verrucomicrobiales bacterium]|nr:hypothetical protein [Verrucomicrobiales bacterium]
MLTAIKSELAEAFLDIENIKENFAHELPVDAFVFKVANGTFTGKTETVRTDGGKVSAVLPITVFAGSSLAPDLSGGRATASSQTTSLAFSIDPQIDPSKILGEKELKNIVVKDFIRDAIVTAYKEAISVPVADGMEGFHPKFTNTALKITTNFAVVREVNAGVASTMIVPAVDLDNLTPSLSSADKKTRTYTLDLEFPMRTGDQGDGRKLIYGKALPGGLVLIEAPYTDELAAQAESDLEVVTDQNNKAGNVGIQNLVPGARREIAPMNIFRGKQPKSY